MVNHDTREQTVANERIGQHNQVNIWLMESQPITHRIAGILIYEIIIIDTISSLLRHDAQCSILSALFQLFVNRCLIN